MDTVLRPRHALDDASAARDQPAQELRRLVGLPDLWQVACRMQPREYSRVNAVGLDLGVCDHAHLQRVRDDDASGMRLEQPHDGHGIAGGLQHTSSSGPSVRANS